MKYLIILASVILVSFSSCTKKDNCTSTNTACTETPPTDELCQAAFNRWFYDQSSGTCTQIGYSGCSQKGFETKVQCEECDCR